MIKLWITRVANWDALLPSVVWCAPYVVGFLVPQNRAAIEVIAVVLPLVAFFIRYRAGRRAIAANRCSATMRRFQITVFCVGISLLVLIEAVLALSHIMPQGAIFATTGDLIVWAVLVGLYLAAMVTAMYPGPSAERGRTARQTARQRPSTER